MPDSHLPTDLIADVGRFHAIAEIARISAGQPLMDQLRGLRLMVRVLFA